MADVFTSYSKLDRQIIEEKAVYLESRGASVWWDTSLVSGADFEQVIFEEISKAKAVLVIWTPNSLKSRWFHLEAKEAIAQSKYLPFHLKGVDPYEIQGEPGKFRSSSFLDNDALHSALEFLGLHYRKLRQSMVPSSSPTLAEKLKILISCRKRRSSSGVPRGLSPSQKLVTSRAW